MKAAEAEGLEKFFRLSGQISTSNMVCFDLNSKIRKYNSPEEILEEFYDKRLEYYGIRKVSTGLVYDTTGRACIYAPLPPLPAKPRG
jgi:DNA gyrase/topoisomerase IV subunit A